MARLERWNVRTLQEKIALQFFLSITLSKEPLARISS
jgi:predicted nuclease of restriction endonuclease-like (RecB) superfamily